MSSAAPDLPYWQVNVPPADRTAACPDFLLAANDKDRAILATPDSGYHRLSWAEVRDVVERNALGEFQRVPSDLRRYMRYVHQIKSQHGSVMDFVLRDRLRWDIGDGLKAAAGPFQDESDVKILCNDWPYGIDDDIVHLVVWTKFDLEENPATGDLSDESRAQIDAFVQRTFCAGMPENHVVWFKNWKSLKSVQAVEHFHVLLYQPTREFVAELTDGDVSMADRLKGAK